MTLNTLRTVFFLVFSFALATSGFATQDTENHEKKGFDAKEMIMHHVKDAHEFHILDWNKKPVTISLPIILWTDNGLITFMSSEFHHDDSGQTIVNKDGMKFVK